MGDRGDTGREVELKRSWRGQEENSRGGVREREVRLGRRGEWEREGSGRDSGVGGKWKWEGEGRIEMHG